MPTALSYISDQALSPGGEGGYLLQHNQYTKNEKLLIPYFQKNNEYFFVDYHDKGRCRWIRTPSQTLKGVERIINFIKKNNQQVKGFRVLPEKWLSKLRTSDYDQQQLSYKLDEVTNRMYLFGNREESFAETFFGVEGLSRKANETKEEWCARITALKDDEDERLAHVSLIF